MKLDLFSRSANSYGGNCTNFVLAVDKRRSSGYGVGRPGRVDAPNSLAQWGVRHGQKELQPADAGRWRSGGRDRPDIVVPRVDRRQLGGTRAGHRPGGRCGPPSQAVRRETGGRSDGVRPGEGEGVDPRPAHRGQRGRHPAHRVREHGGHTGQPPCARRRLRHRERRHPDEQEHRRTRRHPYLHLAHPRPRPAQGRHLAAGQRGLLALPRPCRRHGPRHRRHPQGPLRSAHRPAQGRHPAGQDDHDRLQRHDDQQQGGPREPELRGHGGGPARNRHDHARRVLPHVPHPRSSLGGQPDRTAHRPRRPEPGHRHEDRRPGGLLRLPGHRGRTRGRGRLDVPLPCAEPLRHGHGRAAAGRQTGRHRARVRPARHDDPRQGGSRQGGSRQGGSGQGRAREGGARRCEAPAKEAADKTSGSRAKSTAAHDPEAHGS